MNTKELQQLKLTDILIQLVLLIVSIVSWFINQDIALTLFYAVLGGWQLLSAIVHMVVKKLPRGPLRRMYLYSLILIVVVFLVGLLVPIVVIYLFYSLLFFTPVLAVYYLVVCCIEYMQLKATAQ